MENVQEEGKCDLRKQMAAKEVNAHSGANIEERGKGELWETYKIMSPSELDTREKLSLVPASWQLGPVK